MEHYDKEEISDHQRIFTALNNYDLNIIHQHELVAKVMLLMSTGTPPKTIAAILDNKEKQPLGNIFFQLNQETSLACETRRKNMSAKAK